VVLLVVVVNLWWYNSGSIILVVFLYRPYHYTHERGYTMEAKRLTLWVLDCGHELVPLYAIDEQDGWEKAAEWAVQHNTTLPTHATLIEFPAGFKIHRRELPGHLHE